MTVRLTHATSLILRVLASGSRHGFEVMEVSGLPSGTVYPALRRLERSGYLDSDWEDEGAAHAAGRPRRRTYRLTAAGEVLALQAAERLATARRFLVDDGAPEPADGGRGG